MPSSGQHCWIKSAAKEAAHSSPCLYSSPSVKVHRWGKAKHPFFFFSPFPIQPLPSNKGERGHAQTQLRALFCLEGQGGGHMTPGKEKNNTNTTPPPPTLIFCLFVLLGFFFFTTLACWH